MIDLAYGDGCATNNDCQEEMLHNALTTSAADVGYIATMAKVTSIHRSKQPRRPHFIPEWAAYRGFESQADLAKALDVDKSVVSRWYNGASPGIEHQERLADLFSMDDREQLFRRPEDDWLARFFRDRTAEEKDRARKVLEAAFPPAKTGNDG